MVCRYYLRLRARIYMMMLYGGQNLLFIFVSFLGNHASTYDFSTSKERLRLRDSLPVWKEKIWI